MAWYDVFMQCGLCKEPITTCAECGGLKCKPGCADRAEDGCTCDAVPADSDEA